MKSKVILLTLLAGRLCAGMSLVTEGQNPAPILVPENAHKLERRGAQTLAWYLEKVSEAKFSLEVRSENIPNRAVLVGAGFTTLPDGLGLDGFVIRTEGERLLIAGVSPTATLYAVYAFLEDVVGCRWWSHNEEDVPKKSTLNFDRLDIVVNPPFARHEIMNREAMSRTNDFLYKSRSTGLSASQATTICTPSSHPTQRSTPSSTR